MNTHTTDKKELRLIGQIDEQSLLLKLQNIVTATYLVTDLVPENETLRFQVRNALQKALSSLFSSLHRKTQARKIEDYTETHTYLYEGQTYLNVLYKTSQLSEMNYQILSREILLLAERLGEMLNDTGEQADVSFSLDSFFTEDEAQGKKLISQTQNKEKVDVSEKETLSVQEKVATRETKTETHSFVYRVDDPELVPELSNVKKPSFGKVQSRKEGISGKSKQLVKGKRHDAIIDILKKEPESSVGDICKHIEGCSSKTIQRDLNELIAGGIVLKKGDRRWSSYSLKS